MRHNFPNDHRRFKVGFSIVFVLALAIFILGIVSPFMLGIGGFGPTQSLTVTVIDKHVDQTIDEQGMRQTHFMVTTDKGTFEVDNGWLLGVWNADEIYGSMSPKETYEIVTEGKRRVNFMWQYYPYITKATHVPKSK